MIRLVLFVFIVTLPGCSERKIVSEEELKDYILDPENGLKKHATKNGIDIEVIYRPTELVLVQQLRGLTDPEQRQKEMNSFEGLTYFVMRLSRNGSEVENAFTGDNQKFTNVVNYLSFGLAENIYLVKSNDTIPALDVVYTRMFGASTATSTMIIFDYNILEQDGVLKLTFEDTEFSLGRNEFEFDIASIKETPTLNLN